MDGLGAIITVAVTLGFIAFSFIFARRLSSRMLEGSPEKQAEAKRLMETGSKARATILSIQPTGTILNHINIECAVTFRLEPLDGAAPFDGEKTFYINQTQMPRVGDVWPCWYDPTDPTSFGVGQPNMADPRMEQILADFGIANPLTGATASSSGEPVGGGVDAEDEERLAALERLGDLRARGLLNDDEFEAEKRRLLD